MECLLDISGPFADGGFVGILYWPPTGGPFGGAMDGGGPIFDE